MSEAKILVVTDDPILSRALRLVLSAKGYQVAAVDSSENVPQLSRSGKYDLVLVDDDLYEGAAVEICKRIGTASEIPLIVMNGDGPGNQGLAALHELVSGHLKKPFGVSELFSCVSDNVGKLATISGN